MNKLVLALILMLPSCTTMTSAQVKHVGAGVGTGLVVYTITESPFKACMASFAAGLAKEAYDSTGRGHVSGSDVLYTALPSCALFYAFDLLIAQRAK